MFDVAQIVGAIPEQVEVRLVPGVVDPGDHLRHAVALLGELADDEVVLVVARDREHEVGRPLDAGALEHEELRRVSALHDVLELLLERLEAVRPLLDQRDLVVGAQKQAREVGADLAPAADQHVHQCPIR